MSGAIIQSHTLIKNCPLRWFLTASPATFCTSTTQTPTRPSNLAERSSPTCLLQTPKQEKVWVCVGLAQTKFFQSLTATWSEFSKNTSFLINTSPTVNINHLFRLHPNCLKRSLWPKRRAKYFHRNIGYPELEGIHGDQWMQQSWNPNPTPESSISALLEGRQFATKLWLPCRSASRWGWGRSTLWESWCNTGNTIETAWNFWVLKGWKVSTQPTSAQLFPPWHRA